MKARYLVVMIVMVGLSGCHSTLLGGLEEGEANEIVLALAESGIDADKSAEKSAGLFAVRVAGGDLSRSFEVLRAAGLPRPRHAGFRTVYKQRGLVPGKTEEAALYQSALQEEIAKTLESVEGVVTARVHVTRKIEGRFGRPAASNPTASVLICYHPGQAGELPVSEEQVKKIVAYSIDGLDASRVAVVFTARHSQASRSPKLDRASRSHGGSLVKLASAGLAGLLLAAALASLVLRAIGRRRKPTGGRS